MSDDLLAALALKAGVQPTWRDQKGDERIVSPETLRAVLAALSLPADNDEAIRNSLSALEVGAGLTSPARFVTARVGLPATLPQAAAEDAACELELESGATRALTASPGVGGALTLPPIDEPGYHKVRLADLEFTLAVAPERCVTVADLTEGRGCWGFAAQIYSLRRAGDCGSGDFGGVAALARKAAALGADALTVSPVHALFPASPHNFSPYSPSSRLFYNPLYADPGDALPRDWIAEALAAGGLAEQANALEALPLVDWPAVSAVKFALLRALHQRLVSESGGDLPPAAEFQRFRAQASPLLRSHAVFEAIQARQFAADASAFDWRGWPEELQTPDSEAVAAFAREHEEEISFAIFLQWVAGKSYAAAQQACRDSGMRIGLIADLAIGMDRAGSHAWSRQHDILQGLSIGAPPDYYNAEGQDWGLTTFSPRGLHLEGYAPFIETLRATLRYVGGLRVDHVMGLSRLWLVPRGARATEGCYVHFPSETLFRLVALESFRHRAVVIGEDLGTLPDGFRDYLRQQGVAGLRVLRFERSDGGFHRPEDWDPQAAALTSTHDLVSTAGWWAGADLDPEEEPRESSPHAIRAWDRGLLWAAFQRAGVAQGDRPPPEDAEPVVDAAVRFIARTPSPLKILPLEDALGARVQPNVPGTTTEKPNWRHRLDGDAEQLLDGEGPQRRAAILSNRFA